MVKRMSPTEALQLSVGMASAAATYKNDIISNALSKVSYKLESYGTPFAPPLTAQDIETIKFYLVNLRPKTQ